MNNPKHAVLFHITGFDPTIVLILSVICVTFQSDWPLIILRHVGCYLKKKENSYWLCRYFCILWASLYFMVIVSYLWKKLVNKGEATLIKTDSFILSLKVVYIQRIFPFMRIYTRLQQNAGVWLGNTKMRSSNFNEHPNAKKTVNH